MKKAEQPITHIRASSDMFGRPCLVTCPKNADGARAVYTQNQLDRAVAAAVAEVEAVYEERRRS